MLRPYVVERGKRFGVNRKKSVIRKKHFHIKSKSEKAGEKQSLQILGLVKVKGVV